MCQIHRKQSLSPIKSWKKNQASTCYPTLDRTAIPWNKEHFRGQKHHDRGIIIIMIGRSHFIPFYSLKTTHLWQVKPLFSYILIIIARSHPNPRVKSHENRGAACCDWVGSASGASRAENPRISLVKRRVYTTWKMGRSEWLDCTQCVYGVMMCIYDVHMMYML